MCSDDLSGDQEEIVIVTLFAVGMTCEVYAGLGFWLRKRPPRRRRSGSALSVFADAQVSTFRWLALPLAIGGMVCLLVAVFLEAVSAI